MQFKLALLSVVADALYYDAVVALQNLQPHVQSFFLFWSEVGGCLSVELQMQQRRALKRFCDTLMLLTACTMQLPALIACGAAYKYWPSATALSNANAASMPQGSPMLTPRPMFARADYQHQGCERQAQTPDPAVRQEAARCCPVSGDGSPRCSAASRPAPCAAPPPGRCPAAPPGAQSAAGGGGHFHVTSQPASKVKLAGFSKDWLLLISLHEGAPEQ